MVGSVDGMGKGTDDGVVEFHARGLVEKYGFGKGRMLDEVLTANGYPTDASVVVEDPKAGRIEAMFTHVVLEACVKEFLAHRIKGVRIAGHRWVKGNPVRMKGEFYGDQATRVMSLLDATVARVPVADVLAVARRTAERHGVLPRVA